MNKLQKFYAKLSAPVTGVPQVLQASYFPVLDGLRGVAILMVVLTHIGLNYYLRNYALLIDSNAGVDLFFVISGFLITTLLIKEKLAYGQISLKYFYTRRALRILPVAYLFLLVLVVLNATFNLKIQPVDFISAFLFFKNVPLRNDPYTAHFWSLAVEEQFYLTFPLLLAANVNRYFWVALVIVIVIPVVSIVNYQAPAFFSHHHTLQAIAKVNSYVFWKGPVIILTGSVFSLLVFKGIIKPTLIGANYFFSATLLVAAIVIHTQTFVFYSKYLSEYLSAILMGFALVAGISSNNLLSAVLSNRVLIRVGVLSYSIYIWQELFIGTRGWQPWLRIFRPCPVWVLFIIKMMVIAIIAAASYRFEKQFLKLKSRYRVKSSGNSIT